MSFILIKATTDALRAVVVRATNSYMTNRPNTASNITFTKIVNTTVVEVFKHLPY